jgi:hypothetical protein
MNEVGEYKYRPRTIGAIQWNGGIENTRALIRWVEGNRGNVEPSGSGAMLMVRCRTYLTPLWKGDVLSFDGVLFDRWEANRFRETFEQVVRPGMDRDAERCRGLIEACIDAGAHNPPCRCDLAVGHDGECLGGRP